MTDNNENDFQMRRDDPAILRSRVGNMKDVTGNVIIFKFEEFLIEIRMTELVTMKNFLLPSPVILNLSEAINPQRSWTFSNAPLSWEESRSEEVSQLHTKIDERKTHYLEER